MHHFQKTVSYIDSSRGIYFGRWCEDILMLRCPANVLGDSTPSSLADRCHTLKSLHPPQAVYLSLPVAGPVILYGTAAGVVYGVVYWILKMITGG